MNVYLARLKELGTVKTAKTSPQGGFDSGSSGSIPGKKGFDSFDSKEDRAFSEKQGGFGCDSSYPEGKKIDATPELSQPKPIVTVTVKGVETARTVETAWAAPPAVMAALAVPESTRAPAPEAPPSEHPQAKPSPAASVESAPASSPPRLAKPSLRQRQVATLVGLDADLAGIRMLLGPAATTDQSAQWGSSAAKVVAALGPVPRGGCSPQRWRQFLNDARTFFAAGWGHQAWRLGWRQHDLLGVDRVAPWSRYDNAGLVPMIGGGQVVSITARAAKIVMPGGHHLTHYRRMSLDRERVVLIDQIRVLPEPAYWERRWDELVDYWYQFYKENPDAP